MRYSRLPVGTQRAAHRRRALVPLRGEDARRATALRSRLVTVPQIGRRSGIRRLYLKDETSLPTGSTKDRMAGVAVPFLRNFGVREFALASTGNSARAFVHALRAYTDMRAHLFVGASFRNHAELSRLPEHINVTWVDGDYATTTRVAQGFSEDRGVFYEGGFFNPGRREGLKLAYLEALDQMEDEPTVVVQAVSSGMGIVAARKAFEEYRAMGVIRRTPRLVCAQQDTCAPMCTAFDAGLTSMSAPHIVIDPQGPASAILLGDPSRTYPYVREAVNATGGTFVAVDTERILDVHAAMLASDVHGCESSAVAIGAVEVLAARGDIDANDVVLVNVSGRVRSSRH